MTLLDLNFIEEEIKRLPGVKHRGKLIEARGPALKASLSNASLGDLVCVQKRSNSHINDRGLGSSLGVKPGQLLCQVTGFTEGISILSPFGETDGVFPGAQVEALDTSLEVEVGPSLLGAVINGLGEVTFRAVEGNPRFNSLNTKRVGLGGFPPKPFLRQKIDSPFITGTRAIDGFLTLGTGQRLAVFAEPGVGKSSLLSSLARRSEADVIVFALIGERGREVKELLNDTLDQEALSRSVVICSTSDDPAICRVLAAETAMTVAEYFRNHDLKVLFQLDSLTRWARALREVGLTSGEIPVRRGYPPSVFTRLPVLVERAGQGSRGSITSFYTVLLSSDLDEDPIVEEIKGLTDGHITLSRELAERGHFPAIDVLASISRLQGKVTDKEQQHAVIILRRLLSRLQKDKELVLLAGGEPDAELKLALEIEEDLLRFLRQSDQNTSPFEETVARLTEIAKRALND